MKIALLILLILGGGTGIYYSYEQQEELKATIADRIHLEEKNEVQKGVRRQAEEKTLLAKEARTQWENTHSEKKATLDNTTHENGMLTQDLEKVTTGFVAKQTEYQKIQDELASFNFTDPQEIVDRKEEVDAKNKELVASNDEMNILVEGAAKKAGQLESDLGVLQKKQAEYRKKLANNGNQYQIVAVEPQWGFVVVNAGEDNMITPQTILLVSREGKSIAKLKITSLEKRQTIADIVEGSLAAGNHLQVGDQVILLKPQG